MNAIPPVATPATTPDQPVRSDNLLPPAAGAQEEDDRFQLAEEVSLDQQSDQARQVGALPADPAPGASVSGALADTLKPAPPPPP